MVFVNQWNISLSGSYRHDYLYVWTWENN